MADPIFDAPSPGAPPHSGAGASPFTKQVGPLPLWGWIAVLAASGGIIMMRRKSAAKATATATPDTVTYAQQSQQPTIGNMLNNPGAPIVTGGAQKPATNDEWRGQAVTTLIAKGYSPLTIDTAMALYLAGQPLSTQQQALIDIALGSLGVPPTPPPAAQMAPPTETQPPPAPPVIAANGRSLWQVPNDTVFDSATQTQLPRRLYSGTSAWAALSGPGFLTPWTGPVPPGVSVQVL